MIGSAWQGRALRALVAFAFACGLTWTGVVAQAGEAWAADTSIGSVEEWNAFASAVNEGASFAGETVTLAADLDFTVEGAPEFVTVGNDYASFEGTFEGGFHKIKVSVADSGAVYTGVFGAIGGSAVVRDFTVQGSLTSHGVVEGGSVAGAVAFANGTASIRNVCNEATVTATTKGTGNYANKCSCAGGVVGLVTEGDGVTIVGCCNKATVTAVRYGGGILGCSASEKDEASAPTIVSCYNTGAVVSDDYYASCSGIVGVSGNASNPSTAYVHYVKVYNSLDAGDYETSFYQSYFMPDSPYRGLSAEQANFYKTPIDGGYLCGSSFGRPENFRGVTAAQLAGGELYEGGRLVDAMNTSVTKDAGVEWLPGKGLGQDVPCLDWESARQPGEPVITVEPSLADGTHGVTGVRGVELSLVARTPKDGEAGHDGTLAYQWFEAADAANPDPSSDVRLDGATDAKVATPVDAAAGVHHYYCVVTNAFDGDKTAAATSRVVTATYLASEVAKPVVTAQPQSVAGKKTQLDDIRFSVVAEATDGGALSYQWYEEVLDEGGEDVVWAKVDAAANPTAATAEFAPKNLALGEHAFKCELVNERDGFRGEFVETDEVTVRIVEFPVNGVDDLKRVRDAVNAGEFGGGVAVLVGGSDHVIDLAGELSWAPIGTEEHPFTGTLSAKDHVTIKNMTARDEVEGASGNLAFIGYAKGATLENFTVQGSVESAGLNLAGVLAHNLPGATTKLIKVGNEASIATTSRASSYKGVGGLVGASDAAYGKSGELVISQCYNKGALSSAGAARNFGGLVGYSAAALSVEDSYNVGAISLGGTDSSDKDNYIGGLVGSGYESTAIARCYNTGQLKFFHYNSYYGGIAGSLSGTVKLSSNYYLGTDGKDGAFTWNRAGSSTPTPKGVGYAYGSFEQPLSMFAPSDARELGSAYASEKAPRANKGYPRLAWEPEYNAPKYDVEFVVTGTDGNRVSEMDAAIAVDGPDASSSAYGTFKLTEDVEYRWSVTCESGDYGSAEGTLTPSPESLVNGKITVPVTLARYHEAKFEVTDAKDSSAIDDATISLVKRGGDAVAPDERGRFKVEHGETYDWSVSKDKFDTATGTFVADGDKDVAVALEAGKFTVTFAAADANGAAIEGFTVALERDGAAVDAVELGVYRLEEGVSYAYTVSAEGFESASGEVAPTKAETVTVTLAKAGTMLTVVNQYGRAKEYSQADLEAIAEKTNSTVLKTQYASKNGYGVKAARATDYVTLANLLADAGAEWKHGYQLHIWTGGVEYDKMAGDKAKFESIDAMKNFYPLAAQFEQDKTDGASDANPFSLSWRYYEGSCSGDTIAYTAVEDAFKATPKTGKVRALAGAWTEDGKVQAPGWRSADDVTKIVVERYDADLLEVVNHEGESTTFKLSDLKALAAQNTQTVKMQYAGKNGGTVKAAEKGDYATLDAIFKAANVTWGEGYELEIYDKTGAIYAPGEKWADTSYEYVSNMKWWYPNSTPAGDSIDSPEETPMAIAWTTHTNSWGESVTAAASLAGALNAPAKDEFRLIVGAWYDVDAGMQFPGWRSTQDLTKIVVSKVDYGSVDKTALEGAIKAAQEDKAATAVSEDGSDVAFGKAYASKKAHSALEGAIKDAQSVNRNVKASQAKVNAAVVALEAAVAEFDAAKGEGTVDAAGLAASVEAAKAAKEGVKESADGSDVADDEKWATPEALSQLDAAVAAAEALLGKSDATQVELDAAKKDLDDAVGAFNGKVKAGVQKKGPASLSGAKVTVRDQVWTGKALTPAVSVTLGGAKLQKGPDYTVAFKNNKDVGTATVTIKAVSSSANCMGQTSSKFKIVPKGTSIKKVTPGTKQITVTWKKQAKQMSGYEIAYADNARFSKAKTVVVKKGSTVKKVIKKLSAGKAYSVKIRTYKTVGGKRYYSAWSKAVTAKKTTGAVKSAKGASSGLRAAAAGL